MTAMGSATGRLPDVAVILITYNHEAYVVESLKSVLSQRYPGTIHLVVADDCSTDDTQRLVVSALEEVPNNVVIHRRLREVNLGGLGNLTDAWAAAQATGSPYIALLEGDDFWTDDDKLALQIGHLEEHPEVTLSFGLATERILRSDAPPLDAVVFLPPRDCPSFEDLLAGNFIQTCTVVYRASVLTEFPSWFAACPFRDWPLHLVHADAGGVHYLDRVVAVHRQHETSKWWNPTKSRRERARASARVQRVVIANLGAGQFSRLRVAADRQLWWARASRNRPERWAHLVVATVLDPGVLRRRADRRRRLEAAAERS